MNRTLSSALRRTMLAAAASLLPCFSSTAQVVRTEEQKIIGSQIEAVDFFGNGLDVAGSLMVVGAPNHNEGSAKDRGMAYVYHAVGGVWGAEQVLEASDPAEGDAFGFVVATDGTVIAVNARSDNDGATDGGSVYLFRESGGIWIEEQELHASDLGSQDKFGAAIAVDGDRVVVGSPRNDGAQPDEGAVYVFEFDGATWNEVQKLKGSTTGDQFFYGSSLSLVGDELLVGASHDDTLVNNAGAIYVYQHDGNSFVEQDVVTPSDNGPHFGSAMDRSGDRLIVGTSANKAYTLHHDGIGWVEDQILVASDGIGSDLFGSDVAIDGSLALVGAHHVDFDSLTNPGAAYSFQHDGVRWNQLEKHVSSTAANGEELGFQVEVTGTNLLVAGNQDDTAAPNGGAVLSYFAPALALQAQPNTVAPGDALTLLTAGGSAGQPALLYSLAFDGIPFTRRLFRGTFDSEGAWELSVNVPNDPSLSGHTVTLATFALDRSGTVVMSNQELLTIQ